MRGVGVLIAACATLALVAAIVKAPATPGTYTITFDLVQEGVTWFSGQGVTGGSATLNVQ